MMKRALSISYNVVKDRDFWASLSSAQEINPAQSSPVQYIHSLQEIEHEKQHLKKIT